MSNLISKNKWIKYFGVIAISMLFLIAVVPIISIMFEIIFNAGTMIGSFIRSSGVC